MLFLQIFAFVATLVVAIWLLGVGLVSAWHPEAESRAASIIAGIPFLALAIWIPFAFEWVGV